MQAPGVCYKLDGSFEWIWVLCAEEITNSFWQQTFKVGSAQKEEHRKVPAVKFAEGSGVCFVQKP